MDNVQLVIKPLTSNDAPAFKALRLKAILDSPAALWPTYEEEAGLTPQAIIERIRHNEHQIVFGAFSGLELIGIVGLRREPLAQVAHRAMLWGVFVDTAWRGSGVARKLLDTTVAHAREMKLLQLHLAVHTENPRAEGLYRSVGFERYGFEPRAIRIGDRFYDEHRMMLRLDD
ncbi:GNAT family N-acetyltransferase [Paraburkholderia phenazinium]|uniref:GNAT family N-acetyltransferase n=1 Tax=Paraburkholderia phenazinium TaxID=60549 RepID=UPI0009410302|nr:GNAT family N-acetyltransferase [Paraburkholderia phenazinium]